MGKIVARPEGDKVEIIMSDGEDAAITTTTPEIALEIAMQIIAAAGAAKR